MKAKRGGRWETARRRVREVRRERRVWDRVSIAG